MVEEKSPELNHEDSGKMAAYCFYELDDKNARADSAEVMKWLRQKSNDIEANKDLDNLFGHHGGGPNGAEWNPATNLYIAVFTPGVQGSAGSHFPALYINGSAYKTVFYNINNHLYWYKISLHFLEQHTQAITRADIRNMHSDAYLKAVSTGKIIPVTDLNYGEILRFKIVCGADTLSQFFHCAYGE